MSVNDYLADLRAKNKRIFKKPTATLQITVQSFENEIRKAFDAGYRESQNSKSLFEKILG